MKGGRTVALAAGIIACLAACSKQSSPDSGPSTGNGSSSTSTTAAPGTSILRLDPGIDAIIPAGAFLEPVTSDLGFAEGPVWVHDRIRFSDLTGNKLYEITPDGQKKLLLDKSGGLDIPPKGAFEGSNGSAVDKDGSVLMAQHGLRRIVRVDDGLHVTPFLDRVDGKRFNSPNDIVFAPDGALWITDPPYGLLGQDKDKAKEAPYNAVYRYKDGVTRAVITDLPRPNGIGFSPDGKKLYISNSEPKMFVNVYDVGNEGALSKPKTFISYPGPNPIDVPDGLKVDSQGNVWTSGPGGIRIVTPQGKVLGQIKTPDRAQANLAWGGPDWKTAYIMSAGHVYKLHLAIAGETPLYTK
jgi:gluconolactonase